jgi:hypothetical protein
MWPGDTRYIPIGITNTGNGPDAIFVETSFTSDEFWIYRYSESSVLEPLNSTTVDLDVGLRQTFVLVVTSPSDPLHNMSMHEFSMVSQSGQGDSYLINITSQLLIPELEIVFSSITGNPVDANPISATVVVNNTGYADASQVTVEFYDNGKKVASKTIAINAGETKLVTGNWDLSIGDIGEHKVEAQLKYGNKIIENDMTNNVASYVIQVGFNGMIWIPISLMISAYVTVMATLRLGWNSRYESVLNECHQLNRKVRLDEPYSLLKEAKRNVGIIGTLGLTRVSRDLINQAEIEKEQIEYQYDEVLEKRDELFSLVSMLKERGLDYIEAEEVLEEIQKQLNFLRPDNYSGTEIPDAEKYDDMSISDLEEAQHATVVEEVEEEME